MAFNGSGTYSLVAGNPVVTGTTISSTWANNTLSDIANNGLTNCIVKDGQTTTTARISFAAGISVTGTSVAAPGINLGDSGTGFYRTALNQVGVSIAGTQIVNITSTTITLTGAVTGVTSITTPIVDSGAGALSLKTAGTLRATIGTADTITMSTATTGSTYYRSQNTSGGCIVGCDNSTGTDILGNSIAYATVLNSFTATPVVIGVGSTAQCQFDFTASTTRWVKITGSNGGNPTITTSAGSLAITPPTLFANEISIGTTPATSSGTGGIINLPNTGSIGFRNNANTINLIVLSTGAINSINDVIFVGPSASSGGVNLIARSAARAATASDVASGGWMLWRDTSGATTKLFYNNAGTLMSVALA